MLSAAPLLWSLLHQQIVLQWLLSSARFLLSHRLLSSLIALLSLCGALAVGVLGVEHEVCLNIHGSSIARSPSSYCYHGCCVLSTYNKQKTCALC